MTTVTDQKRNERITGRLTLTSAHRETLTRALRGGIHNQLGDGVLPGNAKNPEPAPGPQDALEITVEQEACAALWCAQCGQEICAGCEDTVVLNLDRGEATCGPCQGLPH